MLANTTPHYKGKETTMLTNEELLSIEDKCKETEDKMDRYAYGGKEDDPILENDTLLAFGAYASTTIPRLVEHIKELQQLVPARQ